MIRIHYIDGGQFDQENAVRAEEVMLPGKGSSVPDVPCVLTYDAEGKLVGEFRGTTGFTVLTPAPPRDHARVRSPQRV